MLSNIYKSSGFRGLFAGVTPRIIKIAPACAIMISSFEYGKSFFHTYNVNMYRQQSTTINRYNLVNNTGVVSSSVNVSRE